MQRIGGRFPRSRPRLRRDAVAQETPHGDAPAGYGRPGRRPAAVPPLATPPMPPGVPTRRAVPAGWSRRVRSVTGRRGNPAPSADPVPRPDDRRQRLRPPPPGARGGPAGAFASARCASPEAGPGDGSRSDARRTTRTVGPAGRAVRSGGERGGSTKGQSRGEGGRIEPDAGAASDVVLTRDRASLGHRPRALRDPVAAGGTVDHGVRGAGRCRASGGRAGTAIPAQPEVCGRRRRQAPRARGHVRNLRA